jgi:voltage-gated potassium channel
MPTRLHAFDRLAGRPGALAAYGLLLLDLVALAWVIGESFLPRAGWMTAVDLTFGVVLAIELALRLRASSRSWRELLHPAGVVDLVAVLSFFVSPFYPGWGFLRSLRTLRLLRSARLMAQLRRDLPIFRRNPEAPIAAADLIVFIIVMTGIVYATQHRAHPEIANWADALYFTVTALTTTGFGDITLDTSGGRMLTVVIMLCGVTLFLRLAQALFRPAKVSFRCQACGLGRHDPDAVHCKACGTLLNIPDDED